MGIGEIPGGDSMIINARAADRVGVSASNSGRSAFNAAITVEPLLIIAEISGEANPTSEPARPAAVGATTMLIFCRQIRIAVRDMSIARGQPQRELPSRITYADSLA